MKLDLFGYGLLVVSLNVYVIGPFIKALFGLNQWPDHVDTVGTTTITTWGAEKKKHTLS